MPNREDIIILDLFATHIYILISINADVIWCGIGTSSRFRGESFPFPGGFGLTDLIVTSVLQYESIIRVFSSSNKILIKYASIFLNEKTAIKLC